MKTVVLTDRERRKVRGWLISIVGLREVPGWEAAILCKVIKKLRRKDPLSRGKLKMEEG